MSLPITYSGEAVAQPNGSQYSSNDATLTEYQSPFSAAELTGTSENMPVGDAAASYATQLVSPFSESVKSDSELELQSYAIQELLADFEDEEFSEAVEALAQEASARHAAAMTQWASDTGTPASVQTEVAQWLESVAEAADQRLATLAEQFGDRPLESFGNVEFEQFGDSMQFEAASPLDAQEDFLKKLVGKVRRWLAASRSWPRRGCPHSGNCYRWASFSSRATSRPAIAAASPQPRDRPTTRRGPAGGPPAGKTVRAQERGRAPKHRVRAQRAGDFDGSSTPALPPICWRPTKRWPKPRQPTTKRRTWCRAARMKAIQWRHSTPLAATSRRLAWRSRAGPVAHTAARLGSHVPVNVLVSGSLRGECHVVCDHAAGNADGGGP
jgi:hypothetical protein